MAMIITKEQKNIFAFVVMGAFAIMAFWAFVYYPNRTQMRKIQSQLQTLEKQLSEIKKIDEIKKAIAEGYVYTEAIENLKKELIAASKRIPAAEEEPLQYMSSLARKFNLEMDSVKPAAKEPLLDESKGSVKVANSDCFKLLVNLRLKGSYKDIVSYMQALTEEAPSLITCENLKITSSAKPDNLTVDANLTIYITSP